MPESWTARGALLLTLLAAIAAWVAAAQAPSLAVASQDVPLLTIIEMRSTYYSSWYAQTVVLVGVVTALWTAYGARNLIPTPTGWRPPAPTTALLRVAERTWRPQDATTPTERGEV